MHPRMARLFTALLLSLFASSLNAATISWGAATGITGDTDVSTQGTLVRAYNFGVDGGTDPGDGSPFTPSTTIINGVSFTNHTSTTTTNTSHSISNAHTMVPKALGDSATIAFIGARSAPAAPYNELSAGYQSFLSTIIYAAGAADKSGTSARNSYTFTLGNLTIGQTYLLQIWFNDSRSGENRGGTVTDGPSVDVNTSASNAAGGIGQYIIGEFTADATTQSFDFTATGSKSVAALMNGYQLRAIPEPSITLLGGLGFAIAAARRKRS